MSNSWAIQTQLATLLALILIALVSSTTAECYWPNGKTSGNYVACPNSKVCCLEGEACLSIGICYAARYNIAYRGACTDSSWPIADCPRACYTSIPGQWANLLTCSGSARGNFTCSTAVDGKTACEENVETWQWEGDSGVNVTAAQNGISSTGLVSDASSGSTTNSTNSTASSSSSSTNASVSSLGKSTSDKSTVGLAVGLGVGLDVPLGLTVSLLIFYCLRVRGQSDYTGDGREETWNKPGYRQSQVISVQRKHHGPSELGAEKDPSELHG